jgi:hypothetical protein
LEGTLREGENRLEIENVGDTGASYSMVFLNRYRVVYPRWPQAEEGLLEGNFTESGTVEVVGSGPEALVLELSDSGPIWLEGAQSTASGARFRVEAGNRYLAVSPQAVQTPEVRKPFPSRLKSARNRAEYLMVGPHRFVEAAGDLLDLRRGQGLRARGIALEQVYSEFGFGEETPTAIKDFLAYAYHQWSVAPRYVVLLGDATYDFKDNLGTGVENHLPPMMVETTYLETASDPSYAAVNGEDLLPDLAIGRLPAATARELEQMIEKIISWESSGYSLSDRIVLVTDNPDEAGDFVGDAEELAATVLGSKELTKIYLSELGTARTRVEIFQAFEEGASLMNYIGHGGIHLWADENILNIDDVVLLAPQSEQPLLLTMNCLNGYFHFPYFDALAERLVTSEGKGAIAAFSPSGLSLNYAAHVFHQKMLEALLQGDHQRLGDAVLAAQAAYATTGVFPELLSIYHLLGDPALNLDPNRKKRRGR